RDEFLLLNPTNHASYDSRYFGPISRPAVIGKAIPLWTW
ncbi:S26 family signal peptidase, partial [Klebsiella pneumoniae]